MDLGAETKKSKREYRKGKNFMKICKIGTEKNDQKQKKYCQNMLAFRKAYPNPKKKNQKMISTCLQMISMLELNQEKKKDKLPMNKGTITSIAVKF